MFSRFEKRFSGVLGGVVGSAEKILETARPHEVFPAASLIKVPILIHLLQECEKGKADLTEEIRLKKRDKVGGSGILLELHDGIPLTLLDLATLMIVVSDNTATNLLIDRVGMKAVQKTINAAGLSKTILGRKLMVAPDQPPANFTTPMDMFALYAKLLKGELLTGEKTELALRILYSQQYNDKIPLLLPKKVKVAHKTGEISGVRHDCGIIGSGRKRWIGCFLTKNAKNELDADRVIAEISLDFYKRINRP